MVDEMSYSYMLGAYDDLPERRAIPAFRELSETREFWSTNSVRLGRGGYAFNSLLNAQIRDIFNPFALWRKYMRRLRERLRERARRQRMVHEEYMPGGAGYEQAFRNFRTTRREYNKRVRIS